MAVYSFVGGSQDGGTIELPDGLPPYLVTVDMYETMPLGLHRCPQVLIRFLHREFYDREALWEKGRVIGHVFKFKTCGQCGGVHVIHTRAGARRLQN